MSCDNCSSEQKEIAEKIIDIYSQFGVKIGNLIDIAQGPRVSKFEFEVAPDTKLHKITKLRDDISLALSVSKVRLVCPVPHKTAFAIEVPNKTEKFVKFDEVFESDAFKNSTDKLCIALGKNLFNENICLELSKAPHLLIGGQSNSGKTTLLKSMICSLIRKNSSSEVKLLLIAPNKNEFNVFENLKHLLLPVIGDKDSAIDCLNSLLIECEERIKLFSAHSVKNIDEYNSGVNEKIPKIVAVVDEVSFLTKNNMRDFESLIVRLAQIGRIAGVHIILATADLTPKTITGFIKANFPARIAFSTRNAIDSRTIIDTADAECLLLKGDFLLFNLISAPQRIQSTYITNEQIKNLFNT